jgi:proline racemase
MRRHARALEVVDYHTEGEPMRIVTAGVGAVPGGTLMDKSEHLRAHGRELLGFTLYEPRGHAAMCGAILVEPVHPEAHAGVLFIEPLGPVHMCGHGAMAVAAMLVETGAVGGPGPRVPVTLETPAGLVRCLVMLEDGHPVATTIQNVPAFSVGLDLIVEVPGLGPVPFDLAYGGHFYAMLPVERVGLRLEPKEAPRIVALGEQLRMAIERQVPLVHPEMPAAPGLLYIQFFGPPGRPDARFRNAVVVAPAGLDRSPCGTGTSARMASLHARGQLGVGEAFGHESLLGTLFVGRIAGTAVVGGRPAIVPEITGRAWMTGRATLVLEPGDPFPGGFLL